MIQVRLRAPVIRVLTAGLLAAALSTSPAGAQPAAAPPEPPVEPCVPAEAAPPPAEDPKASQLAEAKVLFQKGNELRKLGDYHRALELYLRSRQLVASAPNTINAAFCLEQLGRHDEALELYEALLTDVAIELGEAERAGIAPTVTALRGKIGNLSVSANVDGIVLIDGRLRGKLPLAGPLRLLPGERTLRVVKDGWATFEKVVTIKIGETAAADARLEQLARSGRLRVEDDRLVGADLFIDGALIGQLPWEGTLAPGSHFYSVRKGELGSAPREANVIVGQTAQVTVEAGPLSPELRVVVQPPTAELSLNGVPVGKGVWRGALPLGRHTVEAHEAGYLQGTIRPTIEKTTTGDITLRLAVDEDHPRWGRKGGTFWVEALGGYAFTSSLGSGAEDFCDDRDLCGDRSRPAGALAGVRGGYEFPFGVSLELTAGYMTLGTTFQRRIEASFPDDASGGRIPVTYLIQDDIRMSGVVISAGVGYRLGITSWLDAGAAVGLGVVLAGLNDDVKGTITGGGVTREVNVARSNTTLRSAAPFAMPELRLRLRFGSFTAGAGVAVALFVVDGAPFETGATFVVGGDCAANPGTADCAPDKAVVFEERSHGTFSMFLPNITAGYRF